MRPLSVRRATVPERAAARWWRNVRSGRMQRTLAAATAFSALPLGLEIYFKHFKGLLRRQVDVDAGRSCRPR